VGVCAERRDRVGTDHLGDFALNGQNLVFKKKTLFYRGNAMQLSSNGNVEGKLHPLKGKIKKAAGKAKQSGNRNLEAKVFDGKVREKTGQVEKTSGG
jgi:uncharacterized protein YjbJ (UPF0337 family)